MQAFNPVDIDSFANTHRMFYSVLKDHPFDFLGHLNTWDSFTNMRVVTDALFYPAVAGIVNSCSKAILETPEDKRDAVKKAIGAFTCAVMEKNGYAKTGTKKAVPPIPERIFKTGEIYQRITS